MSSEVQAVFKKIGPLATILGLVALAACAYGYYSDPKTFLPSYLFGFTTWAGIAMGCLGFTLLHHTIRGAWGLSVLRIFEAGGSGLIFVILGLLAIPLLIPSGMHTIYHHWTDQAIVANDLVLQRKGWWLNEWFFIARTAIYFAVFAVLASYLRKLSIKEDETRDQKLAALRTAWSAPMLILFVVFTTFAATDWTMSLDPHWFSSMYGIIYMVGNGLAAMTLAVILLLRNREKAPYREFVNPGLTKDLGNLIFVFTLLWAYTSLSQFLIIYMGNIAEFTPFYEVRGRPVWNEISLFLLFGHFMLPFVFLLAPRAKAAPGLLMGIAIWQFVVHFIEQYWNTMPFMRKDFAFSIWDVAALVLFGSIWFAVFARQSQAAAIIPKHDPRLKEAYEHA